MSSCSKSVGLEIEKGGEFSIGLVCKQAFLQADDVTFKSSVEEVIRSVVSRLETARATIQASSKSLPGSDISALAAKGCELVGGFRYGF